MTDEFPWLTGGSEKEPADAHRSTLESLGFEFTEESPTITPSGAAPGWSAEVPTAALVPVAHEHSTALVPTSRRALREAEKAAPASRRSRRSEDEAGRRAARSRRSVAESSRDAVAPRPAAGPVAAIPVPPRVPLRRRIAKKTFPPVVMLAVGALLVGTSVPANALFDPDAPPPSSALAAVALTEASEVAPTGQVIEAEVNESLAATAAARDEWSVTSYAELLRLMYGNRNFSYSTTGTGAVRWPFPYAVPISSGFGERAAPCRGCSSYHLGLDFNPGSGTPIYAIADGTVIIAQHNGGFGNHAIIEHVINGQRVQSVYAHMTRDSRPVNVGDEVRVGDFLGTVGSTGISTGAHLHFEIRIDGIQVDPFAWLQANAS